MIWHIFRKDWKLLWKMVAAAALLHAAQMMVLAFEGKARLHGSPFALMQSTIGTVALLASGLLIIVVVQQDALPGLRQDWLARPVRRRDLLLSKLFFVVLLVQVPIFALEVVQCLAGGFPLGLSLSAPLSRSVWMLLVLDLPLMAFATLTRNLLEAVAAGLLVSVGTGLLSTPILLDQNTTANTPLAWITDSLQLVSGLAAAAAIFAIQYFRGKTVAARWVFGSAAIFWLIAQLLPWQTAFAVQTKFSANADAAKGVEVAFAPGAARYHERAGPMQTAGTAVYIPLRVEGTGGGRLIHDRTSERLIEPGGAVTEIGRPMWTPVLRTKNDAYEPILIPEDVYRRLKDKKVRLEMNLSLTLEDLSLSQTLPVSGGDQWVPYLGHCTTKLDLAGTESELSCSVPGRQPCAEWSIENGGVPMGEFGYYRCQDGYAPYFGRLESDSISRFAVTLGLRDELKNPRIILQSYKPEAHFTRRVVIPGIRLSDWTPE